MFKHTRRRLRAALLAYRGWPADPRYSPEMMIETLSIAQARISASPLDRHRIAGDLARLQHLINGCEAQRER